MIVGEPRPRHDPELVDACKNLYDILSTLFENNFSSLGYSLLLTATPSRDANVYLPNGVREKIEDTLGMKLIQDRDWRILFAHDERAGGLRADSILVSFKHNNGTTHEITFKKIGRLGYLPLHHSKDGIMREWLTEAQQLEADVFNQASTFAFASDLMSTFIDEAGLGMEVPDARDGSFKIARSLDNIPNWKRREEIAVPITPNSQIIIVRETLFATEGGRTDHGGAITAYLEEMQPDGTREQFVVSFPIDGAFVEEPTLTSRIISPSVDDATIANYGPDAYDIRDEKAIPLTTQIIDLLGEELLDALADIA